MKPLTFLQLCAGIAVISGCTHASISQIPLEVPGVGQVYRYQGRANFAHQIAEADKLITEDCLKRNGGTPVVVNLQKTDLGFVSIGNTQASTNVSGNAYGSGFNGTATSSGTTSTGALRNQNQEILYKCVKQ